MYKSKYLKYKNKYLNLVKQIGGDCAAGTDLTDTEIMSQDKLDTRSPDERITIDGQCYFINELCTWIFRARYPGSNIPKLTIPHTRNDIKRSD
jgi:hypothetical protein